MEERLPFVSGLPGKPARHKTLEEIAAEIAAFNEKKRIRQLGPRGLKKEKELVQAAELVRRVLGERDDE